MLGWFKFKFKFKFKIMGYPKNNNLHTVFWKHISYIVTFLEISLMTYIEHSNMLTFHYR